MKRKDLQNWLVATPHSGAPQPGREGEPQSGPGSRARLGRRMVALCIDWWASWLVAYLLFKDSSLAVLAVFCVEQIILLATVGASLGHRLLGLRVRRVAGGERQGIGWLSAFIRTVLLALVIPAVVWDADGRGLHDKAAGTVIVRS